MAKVGKKLRKAAATSLGAVSEMLQPDVETPAPEIPALAAALNPLDSAAGQGGFKSALDQVVTRVGKSVHNLAYRTSAKASKSHRAFNDRVSRLATLVYGVEKPQLPSAMLSDLRKVGVEAAKKGLAPRETGLLLAAALDKSPPAKLKITEEMRANNNLRNALMEEAKAVTTKAGGVAAKAGAIRTKTPFAKAGNILLQLGINAPFIYDFIRQKRKQNEQEYEQGVIGQSAMTLALLRQLAADPGMDMATMGGMMDTARRMPNVAAMGQQFLPNRRAKAGGEEVIPLG